MSRESARAWKQANPERHRESARVCYFRRRYGLTPEALAVLRERQRGCCAVCGEEIPPEGRGVHVDHDHSTGHVRGLLCAKCNLLLGLIGDNPDRLSELREAIVAYLALPPAAGLSLGSTQSEIEGWS